MAPRRGPTERKVRRPAQDAECPGLSERSGDGHGGARIRAQEGGIGAGDGIRTRDILLGKQTLCQLSYSRSKRLMRRQTCILAAVRPAICAVVDAWLAARRLGLR